MQLCTNWKVSICAQILIVFMMTSVYVSAALSDEEQIKRKLKTIYEKCRITNNDCLLFNGSTTKGRYGRYCMTYPGPGWKRKANTTVHKAVYVLETRRPELLGTTDGGEVSHLCGVKLCSNGTFNFGRSHHRITPDVIASVKENVKGVDLRALYWSAR